MAEANPEKRYWDSSAFLARIKREPDRADVCKAIIDDAKAGRCVLFTSMITLTEVVKPRRGTAPVGKETEDEIVAFFRNDFIKLVPVDYLIATRARRLIWDFPWLSARDAIHIATAMQIGVAVIEHYDDDDIGKVGERIERDKLTGFPEIRHPKWTGQIEMPLPEIEIVTLPPLATALPSESEPSAKRPDAEGTPPVDAGPAPEQREKPA